MSIELILCVNWNWWSLENMCSWWNKVYKTLLVLHKLYSNRMLLESSLHCYSVTANTKPYKQTNVIILNTTIIKWQTTSASILPYFYLLTFFLKYHAPNSNTFFLFRFVRFSLIFVVLLISKVLVFANNILDSLIVMNRIM